MLCLVSNTALVVGRRGAARTRLLDVVEVEQIWVGDDLRRVVEQHAVRAIRELVPKSVLRGEVHELCDQLCTLLCLTLRHELLKWNPVSCCRLDLSELLVAVRCLFLFSVQVLKLIVVLLSR